MSKIKLLNTNATDEIILHRCSAVRNPDAEPFCSVTRVCFVRPGSRGRGHLVSSHRAAKLGESKRFREQPFRFGAARRAGGKWAFAIAAAGRNRPVSESSSDCRSETDGARLRFHDPGTGSGDIAAGGVEEIRLGHE
jgi:hypothetical protein